MAVNKIHDQLIDRLTRTGKQSPYKSDANEPDTRYLGYGVRAPEMKKLISNLRPELIELSPEEKLQFATRLIKSGYGEQKTVALYLLEQIVDYFKPDKFALLDDLVRSLHGWSKIDAYTGSFLRDVLEGYPTEFLELVTKWNLDNDLWMRRASVVIFTRKVAFSGSYTDIALNHCEHLKFDAEKHVLQGVGWCLKDIMKADKARVLDYVLELRKQKVSSTVTLYALRDIKGEERRSILSQND